MWSERFGIQMPTNIPSAGVRGEEWIKTWSESDPTRGIGSRLIAPFLDHRIAAAGHADDDLGDDDGVMVSSGLDGCSYSARLAGDGILIHRDGFDQEYDHVQGGQFVLLEPGDTMLGWTTERFHMPLDALGRAEAKSYYQRRFVYVSPATLWPGWRGRLRVEVINHSRYARYLLVGAGILQIYFMPVATESAGYQGQYQSQGEEKV